MKLWKFSVLLVGALLVAGCTPQPVADTKAGGVSGMADGAPAAAAEAPAPPDGNTEPEDSTPAESPDGAEMPELKAPTPPDAETSKEPAETTDADSPAEAAAPPAEASAAAKPATEEPAGEKPAEEKPAAETDEVAVAAPTKPSAGVKFDPTSEALSQIKKLKVQPGDWPQWGGHTYKNNTPHGKGIATEWDGETGENIKWSAALGSQTYGNPIVANGKVYIGTNNGHGYMKRFPNRVDLGVLLCFKEDTGEFLWQHSSPKLPTGRVHDWPNQGICCSPWAEGDRLWYITSRGEVVCLDAEGFHDKENNGPFKDEKPEMAEDWDEAHEADIIWKLDMMKTLRVSQHNMCSCSMTCDGETLYICTSNGVDEAHESIPAVDAPSFMAVDKETGKVLWTDNSPGENILHGQWSSPCYFEAGGQKQVVFGGGDGWLYSFDPQGEDGKSKLLWKFDCNPKDSIYLLQRATRNHLIGTPVFYDGYVYIGVGEDPEHGEGDGHFWCIDPTKRGDVSPTLVFNKADPEKPIPAKRLQALEEDKGDFEKDNPNSAAVWHYQGPDPKGENFEDHMHRTIGTAAIKNDLVFVADFSGLFHCLDAKTGKVYWTHDMLAASWASPLIVEDRVYISDEDGDISIFKLSKEKEELPTQKMPTAVYTSPVVANNVLMIADKLTLYAIVPGAKSEPLKRASQGSDAD